MFSGFFLHTTERNLPLRCIRELNKYLTLLTKVRLQAQTLSSELLVHWGQWLDYCKPTSCNSIKL
jgi:hypothetical protein